MSETKKLKVENILGPALKVALGNVLGPAGMAVEVVKAVAQNNKNAKEAVTETITDDLVTQIAKNPVILNQMNLENPLQSRTAQGGFAATVLSAYMLYKFGWMVPFDQWDINIVYPAFATLSAGLWVLWGRLVTGLPPAFSRIRSVFKKD